MADTKKLPKPTLKTFLKLEQKKLRNEVRNFVKSIPKKMILDMDADKIQFLKEFLQEAGKIRDLEPDAKEVHAMDEKIFE
ncbi:hypothetical protein [Desulfobacula sp.]|uniref:hypothetical protein n=1 Tax=Desulfobacula sp. TaxID=2593537 RepID=UPI002631CF01|nr:hypothetical protein [Desulfobacula sp.]